MSSIRGSALVCTTDERIRGAIQDAGFVAVVVPGDEDALPRVRHDHWTLIAVDDSTGRETLRYLHALPGVRRRDVFVVAVSDRFATGDAFKAWSESVELVVHPDDLGELRRFVANAMKEKDEFYHRFRTLQRAGGALLGAHA